MNFGIFGDAKKQNDAYYDVDKLRLLIQQNSRLVIFFIKKSGNETNKSTKHLCTLGRSDSKMAFISISQNNEL